MKTAVMPVINDFDSTLKDRMINNEIRSLSVSITFLGFSAFLL